MSQSFWDSEAAEGTQPDQEMEPEQQHMEAEQQHIEPEAELEREAQPGTLALSADEFSGLEERILRAVELVKRERVARAAAEERAEKAEAQLRAHEPLEEQLKRELNALRAERDQVRERVERLLAQLDALEL